MPVNKENMNYTVLIIGFSFIFSGTWYVLDAKNWYQGPKGNLEDEDEDDTVSDSSAVEGIEMTSSFEPEVSNRKKEPHATIVVKNVNF